MSIWTCRVMLGGLVAATLTACKPIPEDSSAPARAIALKSAELARGVSVVAPDGYCVDAQSLSRTFALMARCDTLGVRTKTEDVPLAVITVTSPTTLLGKLPEPDALVAEGEALLNSYKETNLQLVQVAGTAPAKDLSGRHWRGVGLVGRRIIGVAIYPAANGPGLDEDGIRLLRETYARSALKTNPPPAVQKPPVQKPAQTAASAPPEQTTETEADMATEDTQPQQNAPGKAIKDFFAGLFQ